MIIDEQDLPVHEPIRKPVRYVRRSKVVQPRRIEMFSQPRGWGARRVWRWKPKKRGGKIRAGWVRFVDDDPRKNVQEYGGMEHI